MSDENIIDVDQNETDTCEEITDTDTISGEDKSENISTNEAAGTTEDIDADYSIDEEPGESSENTSCSEANEATTVSGATASQVAETAGSKRWNEYTSSTDLDDTDELMILDTSAKANKRTLLSKLADYVLGKLADKVFAKLETENKTVIGALNELNSKAETPIISGRTTQAYRMPCSCMCLVLQYGNGNLSNLRTLTLDDEDILSKAASTIRASDEGYLRIIPIYAKQGSLFQITSDSALIIF